MKCKESQKLLEFYFENGKDPLEDKNLSMHINSCMLCKKEMEFLNAYFGALKNVPEKRLPGDFVFNVNKKIDRYGEMSRFLKIGNALSGLLSGISKYKIPFEAAGVLATVMFFILIFKPFEKPEMGFENISTPSMPVTEESIAQLEKNNTVENDSVKAKLDKTANNSTEILKGGNSETQAVVINEVAKKEKITREIKAAVNTEDTAVFEYSRNESASGMNIRSVNPGEIEKENKKSDEKSFAKESSVNKSSVELPSEKIQNQQKIASAKTQVYEVIIADDAFVIRKPEESKKIVSDRKTNDVQAESDLTSSKVLSKQSEASVQNKDNVSAKNDSVKVYSLASQNVREIISKNKGKIIAESFNDATKVLDTFLIEIKYSDYIKLITQLQKDHSVQKKPDVNASGDEVIKVWIKLQ